MKRIFIIHGYRSYPKDCWFPWLKNELTKRGFIIEIPHMPNPLKPTKDKWVAAIKKAVGKPDEKTILIGHSLGTIAITRYLESLKGNQRIGGAIFVAGRMLGRKTLGARYGTITSFYQKQVKWFHVLHRCKKFVGIYSIDDPIVSTENGRLLKQKLRAKLILEKNKGHFSREDKVLKLPIVLYETLGISK